MTYEPEEDHSNKSLKCLVNFESKFDEEESKEASAEGQPKAVKQSFCAPKQEQQVVELARVEDRE